MLANTYLSFVTLAVMMSSPVMGRFVVPEKRHWMLSARRFGQEHPKAIDQISAACNDGTCATLAGQAVSTLLAANPECGQQDFADSIIDASKTRASATEAAAMVAAAIAFRQAEKNTPPDFTTNPPTNRNSVFCQKAPKNPELNGLVQAQDPANGPDLFFDPATKASVKLGAQANTAPFGGAAAAAPAASSSAAASATTVSAAASSSSATPSAVEDCVASTVTVTVAASPTPVASSTAAAASSSADATPAATSGNLQTFTGTLGGVTAPPVTPVGASFAVTGNASFNNKLNALIRSCDVLHNKCADAANASGNKAPLTVDACGALQQQCNTAAQASS